MSIERREENINNELFKIYFTNDRSPSDIHKQLRETESAVNDLQVNLIKKVLARMKKNIENTPKDNAFKIKQNEKIKDIVERILYLNQLNQTGKGLKILTPNQMFSRLPISLSQLKAGNNSEKLKSEIRQLLYCLYRSKNLTKKYLQKFDQHYLNMATIFMNTENSKRNESNKFIYQFTDKLNLKTSNNKNIGLVNLSIYYAWKKIRSEYNNK